jgi:rod shape-determining protein MreC
MPTIATFSQGTELKAGNQVVSSGDGDILPEGLPIGTIVTDGSGYRVALFADQTATQDVEILDFKLPPEHPPATSPDDLPVTAAGLPPASPPVAVSPPAAPVTAPKTKPAPAPRTQPAAPPPGNAPGNDVPDAGNE